MIEQSYGDQSLAMGCVEADVFARMLSDAVRENPGKPVYFKRHPDNYARSTEIHFPIPPEVCVVKDVSPLDMLQYVDRVYVATSQLGFEALMLGKHVKVYGIPFYSHWGLTEDVQPCARRTKKRTVEELFYIAYVQYTQYMSPMGRSTLGEVVKEIVTQREKVFG